MSVVHLYYFSFSSWALSYCSVCFMTIRNPNLYFCLVFHDSTSPPLLARISFMTSPIFRIEHTSFLCRNPAKKSLTMYSYSLQIILYIDKEFMG